MLDIHSYRYGIMLKRLIVFCLTNISVETKFPSNIPPQTLMSSSNHPPPPTGFTNPPLSSSSSNSSTACTPTADKNQPSCKQ